MESADILLFAEDPSAANYVALLEPALSRGGWRPHLYASGVAADWLRARQVTFATAPPTSEAWSLLRRIGPACVLTGNAENPETLGLTLIDASRELGIPSVAFVDALMRAPYRFRGATGDPLAHAPDWLLVPDGITREAFIQLGYPRDHIEVCGHPQYDSTVAIAKQWSREGGPAEFRRRLFPNVSAERKILTFISEGRVRYSSMFERSFEYKFSGRGGEIGRTKVILEEVLDAAAELADKPFVIFRAHPVEDVGDYLEYATEIDCFSDKGSPLELVYASDLTVGMTSMLLLEAALLGRPTLAVLARDSEVQLLPSIRSGLTPHVLNRQDLRQILPYLLKNDVDPTKRNIETGLIMGAAECIVRFLDAVVPDRRSGL